MNRDIISNTGAPRVLFVRFPYGAPLGPGGDAGTQIAVVREALRVLATADRPGTVVESSVDWPE